jgi:choline dehydrogenase
MTQQDTESLPRYADTVVVGGGPSGNVIAGRLAERSSRSVLVLEAGPDYGPFADGHWPRQLLDARTLPVSTHDWQYMSAARHGEPDMRLERARVLGGCSSHNGCAAIWGSRIDYDGWERMGNPGWGTEALLPLFHTANAMLNVRRPRPEEITPWHWAVLDAAPAIGIPLVEDLNDLDQDVGASTSPANIRDGIRWNTAFAYLDPVRDRPNFTVRGNMLVDRVVVEHSRVVAVEVIGPAGPARIETSQVVLSGGAYGSPAVLMRSGIGAAEELPAVGITPLHDLPGVGKNLHDHPALNVVFTGTPGLAAAQEAFVRTGGLLYDEQSILKACSSVCDSAFDLHLYPFSTAPDASGAPWRFVIPVACMNPRSRGMAWLVDRDPEAPPVLDHGYLTDFDGHDLSVLLDGVALARSLVSQAPLADLVGEELLPGAGVLDDDDLRSYIRSHGVHYYHPVGTCKMGPDSDTMAVVDARGNVRGVAGLCVADASIMPVIPRANTNIPSVVIGEKIAAELLKAESRQ